MTIDNNKSVLNSYLNQESSQKYLKLWGHDYPYLNTKKGDNNKLLPVPKNMQIKFHPIDLNWILNNLSLQIPRK